MGRPHARPSIDLTLLEGPRLAAAIARVAPWTTPVRLGLIAGAALVMLGANAPSTLRPGLVRDWGLFTLLAVAVWTLAGIVLRELGRGAVAARAGHAPVAIRVALRPRALPAFHTELQPPWAHARDDVRRRITTAGCVLQLGLAGMLALVSPVMGGWTLLLAALVNLLLAAWTAATGERAFLRRAPAARGAVVTRIESHPMPLPRPSRRPPRAAAWAVLLMFGLPGALALGFGSWQSLVQERRLRSARPVEAVVVATALVDRTRQKHGVTYRPVVRHRFAVDGRTHESGRVHPLPRGLAPDAGRALIAAYPVGARVTTHVPDGDPAGAYLVPLRQWQFLGLALVGLLFLAAAVGGWMLLMRAARASTPTAPP